MHDQMIPFSKKEYMHRLTRVQNNMSQKNIQLLLVNTPENIYYLTGHHSPGYYAYMCLIVPSTGDPTLILRRGETGNAWMYSWLNTSNIIPYDDTEDPLLKTINVLKNKGLYQKRGIALEYSSWFLTIREFLRFKELLDLDSLVDGSSIIDEARTVKSPAEIKYIRKACESASLAVRKGIEVVRSGVGENEVAAAVFSELCLTNSEYLGLEPFVASGPRAGTMHSSWSDRVVQYGETVLIEVAGCYRRYHGALMRTAVIGKPSDKIRKWSEICIESLNAAIVAIKPGVTAGEVDEACRSVIEHAGLYENFRKRTGYSIGIAFAPDWGEGHIMSLKKDDKRVLEPGMVFHMPPALREYGSLGLGFSETVLVTDTGCEVLTDYPRELILC